MRKIVLVHEDLRLTNFARKVSKNLTEVENSLTTPNGQQIIYFGKHGDDNNSGLNWDKSKSTINGAVAAASAQIPSQNNRFALVCLDGGEYSEDVVLPDWVELYAPTIKIIGSISLGNNADVEIHEIENDTGILISKLTAGGTSRFKSKRVIATAGAIGAVNLGGGSVLMYEVEQTYAENGIGIGDGATAQGHVHLDCEDIYITGTGIALVRAFAGTTVGKVTHILELNGGVGNGSAIIVTGGEMDINIQTIDVSVSAYNVGAAGTLNMFVNSISGPTTVTGTAKVTVAGYTPANSADWTGADPSNLAEAVDRIAAAIGPIA